MTEGSGSGLESARAAVHREPPRPVAWSHDGSQRGQVPCAGGLPWDWDRRGRDSTNARGSSTLVGCRHDRAASAAMATASLPDGGGDSSRCELTTKRQRAQRRRTGLIPPIGLGLGLASPPSTESGLSSGLRLFVVEQVGQAAAGRSQLQNLRRARSKPCDRVDVVGQKRAIVRHV